MNLHYVRGTENTPERVEIIKEISFGSEPDRYNVDVGRFIYSPDKFLEFVNGACITYRLTADQSLEILKFIQTEREKIRRETEIKSRESWHESGIGSFQDYCKMGDLVTEDLVDYFMDILPPAYMGRGMLQVGEPYSMERDPDSGKYRNTYTTFTKGEKGWRYCGECFYKQDRNRTDRHTKLERAIFLVGELVEHQAEETPDSL